MWREISPTIRGPKAVRYELLNDCTGNALMKAEEPIAEPVGVKYKKIRAERLGGAHNFNRIPVEARRRPIREAFKHADFVNFVSSGRQSITF
jgi:hypothetical protein